MVHQINYGAPHTFYEKNEGASVLQWSCSHLNHLQGLTNNQRLALRTNHRFIFLPQMLSLSLLPPFPHHRQPLPCTTFRRHTATSSLPHSTPLSPPPSHLSHSTPIPPYPLSFPSLLQNQLTKLSSNRSPHNQNLFLQALQINVGQSFARQREE